MAGLEIVGERNFGNCNKL